MWKRGNKTKPEARKGHEIAKNIIIFGETGAGKSSLINMIAGGMLAETSSKAVGCTFDSQCHKVTINEDQYCIWDTAGLNEGIYGTVPGPAALASMKKLLQTLADGEGVSLLVYCFRGPRVRSVLLKNYKLFYSAICRKKVPIVAVVTGLENESDMDRWWTENQMVFRRNRMFFHGHACVTTLGDGNIKSDAFQKRYNDSQTKARVLIQSSCRSKPWKLSGKNWIKVTLVDVRSMISPRWNGENVSISNVIACDITHNDVNKGKGGIVRRLSMSDDVDDIHVYHMKELGLQSTSRKSIKGCPKRIHLLVAFIENETERPVVGRFEAFYRSCGGTYIPVLVLVRTNYPYIDSLPPPVKGVETPAVVHSIDVHGTGLMNTPQARQLIRELCLDLPGGNAKTNFFLSCITAKNIEN